MNIYKPSICVLRRSFIGATTSCVIRRASFAAVIPSSSTLWSRVAVTFATISVGTALPSSNHPLDWSHEEFHQWCKDRCFTVDLPRGLDGRCVTHLNDTDMEKLFGHVGVGLQAQWNELLENGSSLFPVPKELSEYEEEARQLAMVELAAREELPSLAEAAVNVLLTMMPSAEAIMGIPAESTKWSSHVEAVVEVATKDLLSPPARAKAFELVRRGVVMHYYMTEYEKMLPWLRTAEALAGWKETQDLDSSALARASQVWQLESLALKGLGRYEEALRPAVATMHASRTLFGSVAVTLIRDVGDLFLHLQRWHDALAMYQQVLSITEKGSTPQLEETAVTLCQVGAILDRLEKRTEAFPVLLRALELNRRCLPDDHPELATILYNLGNAYRAVGHSGLALPYFEKAAEIAVGAYGPKHAVAQPHLRTLAETRREVPDAPAPLPNPLSSEFQHPSLNDGEVMKSATPEDIEEMLEAVMAELKA